jgi:hypothetical protein
MQAIENHLTDLATVAKNSTISVSSTSSVASASSTSSSSSIDPTALTQDLKSVFFTQLNDEEFGLACALLFHSDASILRYLENTVTNKALSKSREELLIFIAEIIEHLGKRIQDYALDIKVSIFPSLPSPSSFSFHHSSSRHHVSKFSEQNNSTQYDKLHSNQSKR